jgi:hypothetical protein
MANEKSKEEESNQMNEAQSQLHGEINLVP